MFELRDYQAECLEEIQRSFIEKNRQLVQLPTGSGKTVIFWDYVQKRSSRSLIIVPSVQLMNQCYEMGWHFGMKEFTSCKGGKKRGAIRQHHIVIAHSLKKAHIAQIMEHEFDTIICDEAHRSVSRTYLEFFDQYLAKYPKARILGMTATPERADAVSLLDVFQNLTYSKEIYELICAGYLSELKAYRFKTNIEIKKAKFIKGDFSVKSLMKWLDTDQRNKYIMDAYKQYAIGRKTLLFCINRDHSRKMALHFNQSGIPAAHIDGSMPYRQRANILAAFRSGEIKVLTNCQLLTEGFDEPSIDAIIIARPTRSKALYTQMIGRGVRICPGKKDCLVLELADNYHAICNFSVLAGFPSYLNYDYPQGVTIREMRSKKGEIELELGESHATEANLFNEANGLADVALPSQIAELAKRGINHYADVTIEEAIFLVWRDNLLKKYIAEGKKMANIQERVNQDGDKSYRVEIRKKGQHVGATFKDRQSAELWAYWKEGLIQQIDAFELPKGAIFSLKSILEMKVRETEGKCNPRYRHDLASDMGTWFKFFGEDTNIHDVTYDMLMTAVKQLLSSTTKVGGVASDPATGRIVPHSPSTIRRRLASLSSCVSLLQRNGVNIENQAMKVVSWLRSQ